MKKFLSFSLVLAVVACGSKPKDEIDLSPSPSSDVAVSDPSSQDTGSDASAPAPDGSNPGATDSGPHAPTNQTECIAACETQHPKAASLNKQLDSTCYLAGSCEPVCNNVAPGKNFPQTNDADAAAPVACPAQYGEGVDPIMTPSAACSTCLANTPACCTLWVAIFGSSDGRDLNACAVSCFSKFAK